MLNELDWWIASQWEEMPAKHPLKSDIYMNKNGTPNKGNLYKKLRQSRLKECHIVRYADDFKIFCRSYSDASKLKHAVEQWLMDRLKLETSPDKSRITNLTKGYSDFLGIKFKLYKKGKKWSIKSHMTDKAINSQRVKLKNAMAQACKSHESEQSQHDDLIRYNQAVIGMHQYYNMATMINADVHRLFPSIDITMKTRLNSQADLSKEKPPTLKGAMDEYFYQKYGESKQVRYINGMIVVPVAYCRTQNPMFYRVDTNRYTPLGRERIHRMLAKSEYGETLLKLSRDNDTNHSIEFCDNRLSRFVASKGKCELSKVSLAFEDVECIYLNPPSQGGTDEYANLRIVHKDIKSLTVGVTACKVLSKLGYSLRVSVRNIETIKDTGMYMAPNIQLFELDIDKESNIGKFFKGSDLVIGAIGPSADYSEKMLLEAMAENIPYVDPGGIHLIRKMRNSSMKGTAIVGSGIFPGLSGWMLSSVLKEAFNDDLIEMIIGGVYNFSKAAAIDYVEEIKSYKAGIPMACVRNGKILPAQKRSPLNLPTRISKLSILPYVTEEIQEIIQGKYMLNIDSYTAAPVSLFSIVNKAHCQKKDLVNALMGQKNSNQKAFIWVRQNKGNDSRCIYFEGKNPSVLTGEILAITANAIFEMPRKDGIYTMASYLEKYLSLIHI